MLDFRQKFVRQNRDVWLLQPGGVKDIDDLVGRNGAGNNLPDCCLQFLWRFLPILADAFCQYRSDFLKESNFIPNLQSRFMRHRKREAFGKFADGLEIPLLAVVLPKHMLGSLSD